MLQTIGVVVELYNAIWQQRMTFEECDEIIFYLHSREREGEKMVATYDMVPTTKE